MSLSNGQASSGFILDFYVKKPECPVLFTGMNGQWGFGGNAPKVKLAFSVSSFLLVEEAEEAEEAPTFGRGSLLKSEKNI